MRVFVAIVLVVWLGAAPALAAPLRIVDDRGRTVELAQPPRRIVSLLPSLTETVCALQACDRLVGVDRFSNWPAQVAALPRLGGLEDAQVERIVALKPDLVLVAESARVTDRLESLGLTVVALQPTDFAGTRRMLEVVARSLGRPRAGEALWQRLQARVDAAAASVSSAWRGRRAYVEVAATPYAAGTTSFVGELLARLGLANIVPAALGPFPRLNPEFVVRAQPDVVIASGASLAEMPKRPGWSALRALAAKRQCGFAPDRMDLLVRAGPRLGEAAEAIVQCLAALEPEGR
jgi:iron complex transport system substrate-binding protein